MEIDTHRQDLAEVDRGRHAGEMISELSLALRGKLGLGTVADTIHPNPTQAEAIRQVGDQYNRRTSCSWLARLAGVGQHVDVAAVLGEAVDEIDACPRGRQFREERAGGALTVRQWSGAEGTGIGSGC